MSLRPALVETAGGNAGKLENHVITANTGTATGTFAAGNDPRLAASAFGLVNGVTVNNIANTVTVDLMGGNLVLADLSGITGTVTLTLNNAVTGKTYTFQFSGNSGFDANFINFPDGTSQSLYGDSAVRSASVQIDIVDAYFDGGAWRIKGMSPIHNIA